MLLRRYTFGDQNQQHFENLSLLKEDFQCSIKLQIAFWEVRVRDQGSITKCSRLSRIRATIIKRAAHQQWKCCSMTSNLLLQLLLFYISLAMKKRDWLPRSSYRVCRIVPTFCSEESKNYIHFRSAGLVVKNRDAWSASVHHWLHLNLKIFP